MEAALCVIRENPLSDEAVFAALALVAKKASLDEFAAKKHELWSAIGGANLFKRLFKEEGNEDLAFNILTSFCDDQMCGNDLRLQASAELLQALERVASASFPAKLVEDVLACLVQLRDFTGTAGTLLCLMNKDAGDPALAAKVAECFAVTQDCFFLPQEEQAALALLERNPNFDKIAFGIAQRWNKSGGSNLDRLQLKSLSTFISSMLQQQSLLPAQRRALIDLAHALLMVCAETFFSNQDFVLLICVSCFVQVKVGIEMVLDKARSNVEEITTMEHSARILDHCAIWLQSGDMLDEGVLVKLLGCLGDSLQVACELFTLANGRDTPHIQALKFFLFSMSSSILHLFWADDPISKQGLVEISRNSGFNKACGSMLVGVPKDSTHMMLPVLSELASDLIIPSLCQNNFQGLKQIRDVFCSDMARSKRTVLFFSGLLLCQVLSSCEDGIQVVDLNQTMLRSHESLFERGDDEVHKCCLECIWVALSTFYTRIKKQEIGAVTSKARSLLNYRSFDNVNDIGVHDFDGFGETLSFRDLQVALRMLESL